MTPIKIKPLHPNAFIPDTISHGSAGYDVCVCGTHKLKFGRQAIPLGISLEMPQDVYCYVQPKSGMSLKGLIARTADTHIEMRIDADVLLGLVDSDYRGEVCAIIDVKDYRMGDGMGFEIAHGTPIAQLTFHHTLPVEFILTDTLSDSDRGTMGFGQMDENKEGDER